MEYSNISGWNLISKPHKNRLSKAHHVNNHTLPQRMPSLEPLSLGQGTTIQASPVVSAVWKFCTVISFDETLFLT